MERINKIPIVRLFMMSKCKYMLVLQIVIQFILSYIAIYISNLARQIVDSDIMSVKPVEVIASFALVGVMGIAGSYLLQYLRDLYSNKFTYQLRQMAMEKVVECQYDYLAKEHSATIINKITHSVSNVSEYLAADFPELIGGIIGFVCSFIYLLFVNWSMLLSCVVCIPVSVYVTKKLANPTYNTMDNFWNKMDEICEISKDTISNHKIEKAYNLKNIRREKFNKNMDEATALYVEYEKLVSKASPYSYILNSAPTLICIMVGFVNSYFGVITSGEFVSFVMLLSNISKPLSQFIYNVTAYKEAQVSMERVLEILDIEDENSGEYVPISDIYNEEFAYQVKNITFAYDDNVVLDNLTVDIKSGHMTAFVGESGSGKSTLFKLLAGFYGAQSGVINMYNHDITDWNKESLRGLIACVEQNTYLFNGTIADNIRAGRIQANDEEVVAAARQACAYEFIMQLPEGFNTVLIEGGNNLSGGQKQRIAIARAFVKNAPILLLDEITSALDPVSEKMLQQALDNYRKDKTVVIIAHRLSTIEGADKICVIDKGRLLEEGKHKELLNSGGLYSLLFLKGGASNE